MSNTDYSQKKGLGRGFDALLPSDFDASILVDSSERIQKIRVISIKPNPDQPRKDFDKEAIDQLAGSIKQHGMLQPLIITPAGQDRYQIIAGERRWRAAQEAGLEHVPAIVRSTKALEKLEIALVENVQRVDLSLLEQATSIERLHQQFNISYAAIAKRLNKGDSTIVNIVRLLQLPDYVKEALEKREISGGHARTMLALNDYPDAMTQLLKNIKSRHWSVRQAEQFVQANKIADRDVVAVQKHMDKETVETKRLGKILSAPVTIRRTAHGGKLEIGFSSDESLNEIIERLLKDVT